MDWKSSSIDGLLERALIEDKAAGDITTNMTIGPALLATGSIVARQEMVVSGLGAVPRLLEIYARLDKRAPAQRRFEVISHPEIFDGVRVHDGQVLAVIRHNARVLLSCERVILNLLQHLSGIATLTLDPAPLYLANLSGRAVAGRTGLAEFAARLAECDLLVTNDTGGMHLANALGVPVLVLFGPTNPWRTGPVFHAPLRLLQPPGCSPTGGGKLQDLSPDAVLAAAPPLLPPLLQTCRWLLRRARLPRVAPQGTSVRQRADRGLARWPPAPRRPQRRSEPRWEAADRAGSGSARNRASCRRAMRPM